MPEKFIETYTTWIWRGKPIDTLTREELLTALTELCKIYYEATNQKVACKGVAYKDRG